MQFPPIGGALLRCHQLNVVGMPMGRGIAPALLFSLLLGGCASMAPPDPPPMLPVPDGYNATESSDAASAIRPAQIAWNDYFVDPDLQRLIALALVNNRDLRVAALRVDEARATYGLERANLFPTLTLGVDATRSRVPGDLNVSGRPVVGAQYQVGVGINTWELDFWGRIRSLRDAELESFLASEASRQFVTVGLIAQVADGYLRLRELDERLALASETIASRRESLRIFRRRVDVGATSGLDLTQVETLLQQAITLRSQLGQARATQAHSLELVVGGPIDKMTGTTVYDVGPLRELRPGLPSELLVNRPDIMAAEYRLRAANARIGAARAAFFPRIVLTGSAGTASAELNGLFDSGSLAWRFIPSISMPIFDGARNRFNLDLAAVRRDVAVAQYEQAIQGAFRDVADALSSRVNLDDQVATLQAMLGVQTERARLAKLRYDSGATPFLEVLDAQRDLLSVQQQLVQTRRAALSARVSLYAALGGGRGAGVPVQPQALLSPW